MFKNWLFEVRYRNWKPTRQKMKAFDVRRHAVVKEV